MKESVNHPDHYQGCSELTRPIALQIVSAFELDHECIEVIERYELGFHLGNALKYLWRAGSKGEAIEDLKKAKWYIERDRSQNAWDPAVIGLIDDLIDRLEKWPL